MEGKPPANARGGSLVARYRTTLAAIAARTGTALPSLITSFAILHEATAVVPLVGVFFAAKSFNVGERVVRLVHVDAAEGSTQPTLWAKRTMKGWLDEGEQWVGRVGRRYGIWGFEKGAPRNIGQEDVASKKIAGDVANAVLAYGVTKALLPIRIALSLYLAPGFSRRIIDPLGSRVLRIVQRR